MIGIMMGNSGSHIGLIYGVAGAGSDTFGVGIGSVLLEAIDDTNTNPTATGTILDMTVELADGNPAIDPSSYFTDVDGDTLSYTITTARSDGSDSYTESLDEWNSYTGEAFEVADSGEWVTTITATDLSGASTTQTFNLTVNEPVKPSAITNVSSLDQTAVVYRNNTYIITGTSDYNQLSRDPITQAITSATKQDGDDTWVREAFDVDTNSGGMVGVDSYGQISTLSNTTIDWGVWSAYQLYENSDTPYTSYNTPYMFIIEDRTDTDSNMVLPSTGTINYDIADKSDVTILHSGSDSTEDSVYSNGTLIDADMNINFTNNEIDTTFEISSDSFGSETVSIPGTLDPGNANIFGESAGIGSYNGESIYPDPNWVSFGGISITQGEGVFSGNMMGDNGSHAGVSYHVGMEAGAIASGVVIFEAQQ
jgi:hypothetical protein